MKRFFPTLLAALFAVLSLQHAMAGDSSMVDADGVVHTVVSESWTQGNISGGTVLIHVTQAPDGSESRAFVPGTDNSTVEKDPCIDIDPVSNSPVLVWARYTNRATALYVSRHDNGEWNAPRLIWSDGSMNLEPNIDVRVNLIHIKWKQERQQQVHLRLSLDRETLDPAFGPENLPLGMAGLVPPGADSGPVDSPGLDLSFFASVILPQIPDQPGRIITWGIRDEPVPVVYFQPFLLPVGMQNVRESESQWLEGRFVTWFTSGPAFYYTTMHDGRWDELRVIDLSDGRTTSEALLLLQDLIRR